eukprot:TRINITY_DN4165_c0_g1_i1.p1 TRINITY_DN4165_c0_g1~~TRINITY_DN4165_c0_g1_i1.p1  ORF type:complete len:1014 (+),score=368.54 TRINITY_DN4165_c0_g1_i1:102-3143(+)
MLTLRSISQSRLKSTQIHPHSLSNNTSLSSLSSAKLSSSIHPSNLSFRSNYSSHFARLSLNNGKKSERNERTRDSNSNAFLYHSHSSILSEESQFGNQIRKFSLTKNQRKEEKSQEKEGEGSIRKRILVASSGFPLLPKTQLKLTINESTFRRIENQKAFHESNPSPSTQSPKFVKVAVFLKKEKKGTKVSSLYNIGCEAKCTDFKKNDNGDYIVTLVGERRIEMIDENTSEEIESTSDILIRTIETLPYESDRIEIKALHHQAVSTVKDLQSSRQFVTGVNYDKSSDPGETADSIAALASSDPDKTQEILETLNVSERLRKVLYMIKMEGSLAQMDNTLGKKVDDDVKKSNREYYLKQQMKLIKKELGIEEDRAALTNKFKDRLASLNVPKAVMDVIDEELIKLKAEGSHNSELSIVKTYLDWLTSIPWGIYSKENLEITNAEKILNEDHYGMKDVKERILEFMAVGKLRAGVQGKILCFVGPPGVGKTSIGKSIARALNREFYRFSVGGLDDVSEIKGHRRTYIGSMPGKIVQALKQTKTSNPVIMLDEIDKLSGGRGSHPASALLEVLDPEQNHSFVDYYLDVPLDVSKVLFVVTANTTDTIPSPLLDRMEIVRLSGYVLEEKREIAKKYLIPKLLKEVGLPLNQVKLSDKALDSLITNWCRESGVRNLQKKLEKILRKIAFDVVEKESILIQEPLETLDVAIKKPKNRKKKKIETKEKEEVKEAQVVEEKKEAKKDEAKINNRLKEDIVVEESSLVDYVGRQPYDSDRYYDENPVGVVTGLAWTGSGGSTLYIETIVNRSSNKPGIKITGNLGDVLQESAQIALTYAKTFFGSIQPTNPFFETASFHLHSPRGATPKEGPSAGVSIVSSLISLALGRPLRKDVGMTGEITLTGKVLPIGGVKEKTIAAKRSGIKTVIFPKANQKDWNELEDYIKKDMNVTFADYYKDVFDVAFESAESGSKTSTTTIKETSATEDKPKSKKRKEKKKELPNPNAIIDDTPSKEKPVQLN